MASVWCKASSKASARLMGEHAVLRGGPALVFSLHPKMTVRVRLIDEEYVHISSKFGKESHPCSHIDREGHHRFIKASYLSLQKQIPKGVEIEVHSAFDHTVGLGSSAAVVSATIGALLRLTQGTCDRLLCLKLAQKVIRDVQGSGSGADAAASIFGGVLLFHSEGCHVQKIAPSLPLHLAYSGMKTPTQVVIAHINQKEKENPEHFRRIFEEINSLTNQAVDAIQKNDLSHFGFLLDQAHEQMILLGLENESLADLRKIFLQDPLVLGSKISGSGLGDCLVVLAKTLLPSSQSHCLSLTPDSAGLEIDMEC